MIKWLALLAIFATSVDAETVSNYSASISRLADSVGTRTTIQLKSTINSSSTISITKTFSYSNADTTSAFNYRAAGSSPFSITNQFNTSITTFSNVNNSFKFN